MINKLLCRRCILLIGLTVHLSHMIDVLKHVACLFKRCNGTVMKI